MATREEEPMQYPVNPTTGTCAGTISDNDLKIDAILVPAISGRVFTSSALTATMLLSGYALKTWMMLQQQEIYLFDIILMVIRQSMKPSLPRISLPVVYILTILSLQPICQRSDIMI